MIAPVTIEKDAYTAAGSVISENVPAEALAIARARQVNKEGYAHQLRRSARMKHESNSSTLCNHLLVH